MSTIVFAHSGGTDANGGHYDHSSGEYHYHHGQPAHQHYDIDGDGKKECGNTIAGLSCLSVAGSAAASYITTKSSTSAYEKSSGKEVSTKTKLIIGIPIFALLFFVLLFLFV